MTRYGEAVFHFNGLVWEEPWPIRIAKFSVSTEWLAPAPATGLAKQICNISNAPIIGMGDYRASACTFATELVGLLMAANPQRQYLLAIIQPKQYGGFHESGRNAFRWISTLLSRHGANGESGADAFLRLPSRDGFVATIAIPIAATGSFADYVKPIKGSHFCEWTYQIAEYRHRFRIQSGSVVRPASVGTEAFLSATCLRSSTATSTHRSPKPGTVRPLRSACRVSDILLQATDVNGYVICAIAERSRRVTSVSELICLDTDPVTPGWLVQLSAGK